MPQSNEQPNKQYGTEDLRLVLDRLADFDTRLEQLVALLVDILVAQRQANLPSSPADRFIPPGLSGPPSQEQFGQILSRFVLNRLDEL